MTWRAIARKGRFPDCGKPAEMQRNEGWRGTRAVSRPPLRDGALAPAVSLPRYPGAIPPPFLW